MAFCWFISLIERGWRPSIFFCMFPPCACCSFFFPHWIFLFLLHLIFQRGNDPSASHFYNWEYFSWRRDLVDVYWEARVPGKRPRVSCGGRLRLPDPFLPPHCCWGEVMPSSSTSLRLSRGNTCPVVGLDQFLLVEQKREHGIVGRDYLWDQLVL